MSHTYAATLYTGPDAQRSAAARWKDGDLFVVAGTGALWVRVAGAWQLAITAGAPATLTAANAGALNSGDATTDAVIGNLRTRLGELETKLAAAGLLT